MSEHAYRAQPSRRLWHAEQASPLTPLAVAGVLVVALAAIWLVAELVPAAHLKDAVALYELTSLSRPRLDSVASFMLHLLDPSVFVLWGIALVSIAIARERARVAAVVVVVLAFAPLSADRLKPLLAHSHDQIGYVHIGAASWPSGHSTAAAALALCAVLVSPARLRPAVAALGLLFVLAVGFSLLILGWHMPSDVLGGYLVAGLWTALGVAALRAYERRRPPQGPTAAPRSAAGSQPG
jgi:membrane-associated phospholipid phosphatase